MFMSPFGDPAKGHTAEATANFYGYSVARSRRLYGFAFHGACQMGNHHHLNVTDRLANRPYFKNSIHSVLARGFNARFARFDSFWSGGGSCDTVTPSDEQTLKDLAYGDINPVAAGLVKWGDMWPGFTSYNWRFGETRTFVRPDWFFDPSNPDNPETVTLTRVRPNIFPELSDDELSDRLADECRKLEVKVQMEMKEQNRRFVGLKKLAKTKWWRRAKAPEQRFKTVPTVASSQAELRTAELARNKVFEEEYGEAREKFIRNEPVEFPFGSFMLPQIYGVPVLTEPSAALLAVAKPP